jgi:hypothetical protein
MNDLQEGEPVFLEKDRLGMINCLRNQMDESTMERCKLHAASLHPKSIARDLIDGATFSESIN